MESDERSDLETGMLHASRLALGVNARQLARVPLSQLARCKDDAARRILLGVKAPDDDEPTETER